ncbi:MAG: outer membrane beta-barrel protein [Chitinophagales bacterium]
MKRYFTLLLFLVLAHSTFAITDKIKLGFTVSPGISWAKPFGKELKSGGVGFGLQYGLSLEYWFAENFGLSTGLFGAMENGSIKNRGFFRDTITGNSITEKYTFHSLVLPIGVKLRTNDIKNFRIYGEVLLENFFTVSARSTFSDSVYYYNSPSKILIEKENILRKGNDVSKSIPDFRANFYDVRFAVGGGFEYHFNDKVALTTGIYYHNGFLNYLRDNSVDLKKEPTVMRSVNLKIGVLF